MRRACSLPYPICEFVVAAKISKFARHFAPENDFIRTLVK